MSRIAKEPVNIPKDVESNLSGQTITLKGSKGSLSLTLNQEIELKEQDNSLLVQSRSKSKFSKAVSGTTRALLANMVQGVSEGFEKN